MRDDVAGPDGSALSEELGLAPERCDQCRTPNACSDGACLEAYIGRRVQQEVAAERERFRVLICGPHIYNGDCPEAANWHRRDIECPACAELGEWRA
jgi:hypothetical protein